MVRAYVLISATPGKAIDVARKLKDQDGIVDPEHIAETYWMLHRQPRDAWTHELDLRPWMEKF